MMFQIHSAFSLETIALVAGVALLLYIKNQPKVKSIWPVIAAWFVIGFSILSIICTAYSAISFCNKGYCPMSKKMMNYQSMVEKDKEMKE